MDFAQILAQDKALSLIRSPFIMEGPGRDVGIEAALGTWLCQSKSQCGICAGCKKRMKGFHPDWLEVSAESGIEDIREALTWLRKRPFENEVKVLVIKDLGFHHTAIQNALLKTLEEPSPRWALLLSVPSRMSLLETVRSRCRLWFFPETSPLQLTDSEEEVFGAIQEANELLTASLMEKFLKDRAKALETFERLLEAASQRTYPGLWQRLAPEMLESLDDLRRNLNQKIVWDALWIRAVS
jgi:DNA polymerase III delta prime subunit